MLTLGNRRFVLDHPLETLVPHFGVTSFQVGAHIVDNDLRANSFCPLVSSGYDISSHECCLIAQEGQEWLETLAVVSLNRLAHSFCHRTHEQDDLLQDSLV